MPKSAFKQKSIRPFHFNFEACFKICRESVHKNLSEPSAGCDSKMILHWVMIFHLSLFF